MSTPTLTDDMAEVLRLADDLGRALADMALNGELSIPRRIARDLREEVEYLREAAWWLEDVEFRTGATQWGDGTPVEFPLTPRAVYALWKVWQHLPPITHEDPEHARILGEVRRSLGARWPSARCRAVTSKGEQCRNDAVLYPRFPDDEPLCGTHDRDPLNKEHRAAKKEEEQKMLWAALGALQKERHPDAPRRRKWEEARRG